MRTFALVLLGSVIAFGSVIACGGEVAPETSDKVPTKQTADRPDPNPPAPAKNADESALDRPSSSGRSGPTTPSETSTDEEYPPPTWGPDESGCFLAPGPDAPGECDVGTQRDCPPGIEPKVPLSSSSSSGTTGNDYCRQRCVNVNGTARWSEPTNGGSMGACPYYDTNLFVGDPSRCGCATPLVLSFDDAPVVFRTDATGTFDLTRNGMSHGGDWPSAATPWLALDRDGNGTIDDGGELFGSATRLAAGGFARNGFAALRDLDSNEDGSFDADDAAYSRIVVWTDRNADRVSTPDELTSLAEAGVRSIDLNDHREVRCDARNNCEGERSRFTRSDGRRGTVIDVYLPMR